MDKELIYMAGLFDGEGCVSINKVTAKQYKKPGYQLRVTISITDEPTAILFKKRFGGFVMKRSRARAKDYWQWVLVAKGAHKFLIEIEPFLRIKKEVANLGIEFQSYRQDNRKYNKTEEYRDKEFCLYEGVRKQNARWGTEYYSGT